MPTGKDLRNTVMEALSDKYKVKKVFIKRAAYFNLTFTS